MATMSEIVRVRPYPYVTPYMVHLYMFESGERSFDEYVKDHEHVASLINTLIEQRFITNVVISQYGKAWEQIRLTNKGKAAAQTISLPQRLAAAIKPVDILIPR